MEQGKPFSATESPLVDFDAVCQKVRAAVEPARAHAVSLHDEKGDVLWLSESSMGPDEHNAVREAIETFSNGKAPPILAYDLGDARSAVLLRAVSARRAMVGAIMVVMDSRVIRHDEHGAIKFMTPKLQRVLMDFAGMRPDIDPRPNRKSAPSRRRPAAKAPPAKTPAKAAPPSRKPPLAELLAPSAPASRGRLDRTRARPPCHERGDRSTPGRRPGGCAGIPCKSPAPGARCGGASGSCRHSRQTGAEQRAARALTRRRVAAAARRSGCRRCACSAHGGFRTSFGPASGPVRGCIARSTRARAGRTRHRRWARQAGAVSLAGDRSAARGSAPQSDLAACSASGATHQGQPAQALRGAAALGVGGCTERRSARHAQGGGGNGLGSMIDRRVVTELVGWLVRHPEVWQQHPVMFSVNLTTTALHDEHFIKFVGLCLAKSSLPKSMIAFEVDVATAVKMGPRLGEVAAALERLGCPMVLDDFSLKTECFDLLRLPGVRYVKLAPEITHKMRTDKLAQASITAVVQMARVLGMHTVAKRMETAAEQEWLTALGVDFVQSRSMSPPASIDSLVPASKARA
jgi:EAL domain-containing protein (putative c-di-GMP-specific phosphodiesterase class I)